MPTYGTTSLLNLSTADARLQRVFKEVIKVMDNSILHGERTTVEQYKLFKQGRLMVNERWVIQDESKIVTYKDGIIKKSTHNYSPSKAVDAVPYPIDWQDTDRARYFAGIVTGVAMMMGESIRWGGDWDRDTDLKDQSFMDLYHFEVVD